jgi:Spy/CpxP family protein refolding chaperone
MKRMHQWIVVLGLLFVPAAAAAQVPPQEENPLEGVLFEPEVVMLHRRAIGLTDEQRDAISRMIQDLQGKAVGLQWELLDQMQTLKEILQGPRIDQDRALDQLERALETEKRIKRAHLELLIRIKNVLTEEQQRELTRLRERDAGGGAGTGNPGS